MTLSPHQRKRIAQLIAYVVIPVLFLVGLDWLHRGLGRLVLGLCTGGFVIYCFVNDDKPWARRILNEPKKWWQ